MIRGIWSSIVVRTWLLGLREFTISRVDGIMCLRARFGGLDRGDIMYVTNFQYFCALVSMLSVGFALGLAAGGLAQNRA